MRLMDSRLDSPPELRNCMETKTRRMPGAAWRTLIICYQQHHAVNLPDKDFIAFQTVKPCCTSLLVSFRVAGSSIWPPGDSQLCASISSTVFSFSSPVACLSNWTTRRPQDP
ncbi:hypothetical protein PILCRDRAFT_599760 [Piloderma croceum F 1598]|uniref:Uncharacterized protein n=1 Tax=Piloderma croceum (strain F 1598) TaxID=765440 RepID=A0A0C3AW27_PILCF|nr:hypothetical protein PILCRDRAFT_599760 [Piloderma croceum F 1598]